MKTAFLIILAQLLFSCSRDEELAEKTQVQSREEINQQNQNLERWSKDLKCFSHKQLKSLREQLYQFSIKKLQ